MGELKIWPDNGLPTWADDGTGTLRGTIAFTVENTATEAAAVTFDAVPEGGTPPEWLRVEHPQLTVPAGAAVRADVLVELPSEGGFERYHLRGRVRAPGLPEAVSDQVHFSRPLPSGWRLESSPDTYLDLSFGTQEIVFSFHAAGLGAGSALLFDIGAPDSEAASWFSVDQPVWDPSGTLGVVEPGDVDTGTWRVSVDAHSMASSGRRSVWLQPFVKIDRPGEIIMTERGFEPTGWRPYAHWWGYGVELGG